MRRKSPLPRPLKLLKIGLVVVWRKAGEKQRNKNVVDELKREKAGPDKLDENLVEMGIKQK